MGSRKNNTGLFKKIDGIIGEKFGRLTVIEELQPVGVCAYRPNGYRFFRCICECGSETNVRLNGLRTHRIQSCGCLSREVASNRMKSNKIWEGRKHSEESKKKMGEKKRTRFEGNILEIIRCCAKMHEWRKSVYERDGYTCVVSGEKSNGNLNAHHLDSLTTLVKKYNIKTIEDAYLCDELWSVDNGVTLLKPIHKKFHYSFGRGFNTKEQFIDFINIYGRTRN